MTLKSMTAFGSGEFATSNTLYRCEVRTLNSRFCDVSIKLPRSLIVLEPQLLNVIKARLQRGKVDVFFELQSLDRRAGFPTLNTDALEHYKNLLQQLSATQLAPNASLSAYEIMRLEGVLESRMSLSAEDAKTQHEAGILKALEQSLASVVKQRGGEGKVLEGALTKLLESIRSDRQAIMQKRDSIQTALYENYRKRLERLLGALEETGQKISSMLPEDRLLSELAILTDRSDIEEELTRLEAHENEFARIMQKEDDAGRKLDFLCQEMHREVNTISNKLVQLDVSQHSLSLKQTVERLRQQVQNIE